MRGLEHWERFGWFWRGLERWGDVWSVEEKFRELERGLESWGEVWFIGERFG